MYYKWIGAALIISSCSCFGFSLALHQLRETRLVEALNGILGNMVNELSYKLTPLPELVRHTAESSPPPLRTVFSLLADNLDRQVLPDASCCMESAVGQAEIPYLHVKELLMSLVQSLGRFDLEGQLKGLAFVQEQCRNTLIGLKSEQAARNRSFRVLGLCAGIALAILLI